MWCLFKLNRSRWLTRQIIEYSIHPTNFIYNSAHHFIQNFIRNLRRLCSHEINRINGSKSYSIIISSLITHNTNASHIRKCCKILTNCLIKSGIFNLFTINSICILNDTNFLSCYFADDTYSKSRSWEWLTEYESFRQLARVCGMVTTRLLFGVFGGQITSLPLIR